MLESGAATAKAKSAAGVIATAKIVGPAKGMAAIGAGKGLAAMLGLAAGIFGGAALMAWTTSVTYRHVRNNVAQGPAGRAGPRTHGVSGSRDAGVAAVSIPVESPWESTLQPVEAARRRIRIRVETPWEWAGRSANALIARVRPIRLPFGFSL